MKIYSAGTARIKHNSTGAIYDIESDQLDWDDVGGADRPMGPDIHYQATITHPALGELSWELWEYPVGIENFRQTNAGPHAVIEDFDYGLEHNEPEPDQWADYSVPADPYTIFMSSYHHTGDLLADHGSESGSHLVNRMVFSHQIAAMEAYLADRLINGIETDAAACERLLNQYDDLTREKFTLAEILKDPVLVKRKVREHLRSIQYHNIAKVDVLYHIAFGIRLLHLTEGMPRLFKAVLLRHDCVHRNGFDKDGKELNVFTKAYIQETADLIKSLVENIEKAMGGQNRAH